MSFDQIGGDIGLFITVVHKSTILIFSYYLIRWLQYFGNFFRILIGWTILFQRVQDNFLKRSIVPLKIDAILAYHYWSNKPVIGNLVLNWPNCIV